jgi:glucosyl-3-phosphoglycerate synthase
MRLPFCCGYGVDIALLIDAWRVAGIGAIAQVDLDARQNRHQPLADLSVMAAAVMASVTSRLVADGRVAHRGSDTFLTAAGRTLDVDLPERPPMADYVASARRSRFTVASA